ncbi:MAG: DoxX family protein [Parcubacteria group bacterium]|nr:DoxX family protein [Parcubacteria group bacterium]MBI3075042.1 DoxX family protein [Parcubacteria group bacterium]
MKKISLKIDDGAIVALLALRLSLGWLFFYAGITKIFDADWTAAGYLAGAKTFPALFHWFALPTNIGWVDFVNEWGLTLVGLALLTGFFVRYASIVGALFMILYYLPALAFPYPNAHSFIVDEHVIYALALSFLAFTDAGKVYGLDGR